MNSRHVRPPFELRGHVFNAILRRLVGSTARAGIDDLPNGAFSGPVPGGPGGGPCLVDHHPRIGFVGYFTNTPVISVD